MSPPGTPVIPESPPAAKTPGAHTAPTGDLTACVWCAEPQERMWWVQGRARGQLKGAGTAQDTVTDSSSCCLNLRERGPVCRPAKPQKRKTSWEFRVMTCKVCAHLGHIVSCAPWDHWAFRPLTHKTPSPKEGPAEGVPSSGCVPPMLLYTSHLSFESYVCFTPKVECL